MAGFSASQWVGVSENPVASGAVGGTTPNFTFAVHWVAQA